MKKKCVFLLVFVAFQVNIFSQSPVKQELKDSSQKKIYYKPISYEFLFYDSYNSTTTMKITSQNLNSVERFCRGYIGQVENSKNKKLSELLLLGLETILYPYSHEEGHRSVLTYENIGSIASVTFDFNGVATVRGVMDSTLQNLRDTKLPTYIRLHTGGIESDYLKLRELNRIFVFDEDFAENIKFERLINCSSITGYYFFSLFPALQPHLKESKNQLENDIVGHDVYGAIKNLFRPNIPFYRYTQYENLTDTEKKFLNKVAFGSLLNIITPDFINFKNGTIRMGFGFTMVPFGNMYEADIYVHKKNEFDFIHTVKSYENNTDIVGLGLGLAFRNIILSNECRLNIEAEAFRQPQNMDFNTNNFFYGGYLDATAYLRLNKIAKIPFSINLGITLKSNGFVLGEPSMNSGMFFRMGMSYFTEKPITQNKKKVMKKKSTYE